jgi:plasmid stabilization system protein ParE
VSDYVLSLDAEFDLDHIWEYIAADSIYAADRWITKLFDAFEALAQTPGMGHHRDDLTSYPVLFWPVGAYVIVYRPERNPIEIIAVTQGVARHSRFLEPTGSSVMSPQIDSFDEPALVVRGTLEHATARYQS